MMSTDDVVHASVYQTIGTAVFLETFVNEIGIERCMIQPCYTLSGTQYVATLGALPVLI